MTDNTEPASPRTRRQYLVAAGALGGIVLLAGCTDGGTETAGSPDDTDPGTMNGMTDSETDADTAIDSPEGTDTPAETETPTPTAGTDTTTPTPTDGAAVRVAHFSPDAPNVDVAVDGSVVLEDVPFGAVSDYLALAAGAHTVTITPAGSETIVFEGEVTVAARTAYTVVAIGEVSEGTEPWREHAADEPHPWFLPSARHEPDGPGERLRAPLPRRRGWVRLSRRARTPGRTAGPTSAPARRRCGCTPRTP